jgi:hypothetical protein
MFCSQPRDRLTVVSDASLVISRWPRLRLSKLLYLRHRIVAVFAFAAPVTPRCSYMYRIRYVLT